jgi:hypothetical protein
MVNDWLLKKKDIITLKVAYRRCCIIGLVLNCKGSIVLYYLFFAYNIPDSGASEYSTKKYFQIWHW